jgi:hypothetical protein
MSEESMVPLSATLAGKVDRLFRASTATVLAGFFGLLLVIVAGTRSGGETTALMHGAGCALILYTLALVLVANRKAKIAARSLKDDLPLLDDLQQTVYRISEMADVTQNFAFKHLMRAQRALSSIESMVGKIPFIGAAVKRRVVDLNEVSARLSAATLEANGRIRLLQEALRNADLQGVREYGRQVDAALANLRKSLDAEPHARSLGGA